MVSPPPLTPPHKGEGRHWCRRLFLRLRLPSMEVVRVMWPAQAIRTLAEPEPAFQGDTAPRVAGNAQRKTGAGTSGLPSPLWGGVRGGGTQPPSCAIVSGIPTVTVS